MQRVRSSRFGWNWLDTNEWCDGLMDDQGDFIPEYRLLKDIPMSLLLYLVWHD